MDDDTPGLLDAPSLPVTTGTIAVSLGLFLLVDASAADAIVLDVRALESEPWRLVTTALLHGDLFHLLFNLIFLWRLGAPIEARLGHARLGVLLLLFAAVSSAAEYGLNATPIGLSGAVYGLFAFTWVLDVTVPAFRGAIDRTTRIVFIAWFFVAVGLTEFGLLRVANLAHGVGALSGALMGWGVGLRDWRRWIATAAMVALALASLASASLARPMVNLARHPGIDSARLGEAAYQVGDYGEAVRRFGQATAYRSVHPDFWFNYGLSLERLGARDPALEAYRQALQLDDDHPKALAARARLEAGVAPDPSDTAAPASEADAP